LARARRKNLRRLRVVAHLATRPAGFLSGTVPARARWAKNASISLPQHHRVAEPVPGPLTPGCSVWMDLVELPGDLTFRSQ